MRPASCLLLTSAVLLAACAPSGATTGDTASAAAPTVDVAAEEQAIRDLGARRMRAVAARDTVAVADFYASDALFMPPNAQALGGRPGVLKGWRPSVAYPPGALRSNATRVLVARSGDLAYEAGSYTLSYPGPKGSVNDTGKYVVVWKKQDGDWKITVDIFNSDKAAAR